MIMMYHCSQIKTILICLIISGFWVLCQSPFSIRDPELPKTVRSTWVPPYSPDLVLTNMKNAISEKNIENYTRCLIDSAYSRRNFIFEPSPEVFATHPAVFLYWNRTAEQSVMQQVNSLVPSDSILYVNFFDEGTDIISADSAVFNRSYHLEVHHTEGNIPVVFEGYSQFWIAPDERGEWSIYRWIDNTSNELPTWSSLKASIGS